MAEVILDGVSDGYFREMRMITSQSLQETYG